MKPIIENSNRNFIRIYQMIKENNILYEQIAKRFVFLALKWSILKVVKSPFGQYLLTMHDITVVD